MLRAGNFYRSNGGAFEGRKQDAPEGVSNGVTVASLKRLGGELCIGFSGCALVFCESLWHFKTTVTDRHILISDCRLLICDLKREERVGDSLNNRKLTTLNLQLLRRVPPGERDLTSSDGDPGTNGVISKTRCELGIKTKFAILQAPVSVGSRTRLFH